MSSTDAKIYTVKDLRAFGLILAGLLGLLGRKLYMRGWAAGPALWAVCLVLVVLALARPRLLEPLVRRWMKVARVLAFVNTFVVLAVVYYVLLTPFALILRLRSRDPLEEKPNDAPSYWKPRDRREAEGLTAYERQF